MSYSDDPSEWWDINAPLGENRRYSHGQGCAQFNEGPDHRGRLFVKRTQKGWQWYCHNCGGSGFRKHSARDLSRLYTQPDGGRRREECIQEDNELFMPPRKTMPHAASNWFLQYGITEREARHYGFYYTEYYGGRLILPITKGQDEIIGYQARRISGDGPKYITKKRKGYDEGLYFRIPRRNGDCNVLGSSVVVTEDILSAIKVARCGVSTLALLGSPDQLPTSLCLTLEEEYDNIIIWLDPDKTKTAARYVSRLTSLFRFKSVRAIASKQDPKECNNIYINKYIFNI